MEESKGFFIKKSHDNYSLGEEFTKKVDELQSAVKRLALLKVDSGFLNNIAIPVSIIYDGILKAMVELLHEDSEVLTNDEILNLSNLSSDEINSINEYLSNESFGTIDKYLDEKRYFYNKGRGQDFEDKLKKLRMVVTVLHDNSNLNFLPQSMKFSMILSSMVDLLEIDYKKLSIEELLSLSNLSKDELTNLDDFLLESGYGVNTFSYLEDVCDAMIIEENNKKKLTFRSDGRIEITPNLDSDLDKEFVEVIKQDLEDYFKDHNSDFFEETLRVRDDGYINGEERYDEVGVKPRFGIWFHGVIVNLEDKEIADIPGNKKEYIKLLAFAEDIKRMKVPDYKKDNRFEFISVKLDEVYRVLQELKEYLPEYEYNIEADPKNRQWVRYTISKKNVNGYEV